MKNKNLILLIAGFIILIGVAYILYNNLADDYVKDSFVGENSNTPDLNENPSETTDSQASNEASSNNTGQAQQENELQMAPDFIVYDQDGNAVNLTDYFGKPIVLNFWASWCGPCKSEMPGFDKLYQKYKDEINFVMVNLTDGASETVKSATNYIETEGYTFPILFDSDMNAASTYGISSIPTTYLINDKGEIVAYVKGAVSEEALEAGMQNYFDGFEITNE